MADLNPINGRVGSVSGARAVEGAQQLTEYAWLPTRRATRRAARRPGDRVGDQVTGPTTASRLVGERVLATR